MRRSRRHHTNGRVRCSDTPHRIAEHIKLNPHAGGETGAAHSQLRPRGTATCTSILCRDDLEEAEWERRMNAALEWKYQKAAEMGAQVSGEHGPSEGQSVYIPLHPAPPALLANHPAGAITINQVKHIFRSGKVKIILDRMFEAGCACRKFNNFLCIKII